MIHEFTKSIPVTTPLGDGFAIYVTEGGYLNNDEWTVVMKKGGSVKHFTTADIRIFSNGTYGIEKTTPVKMPVLPTVEDSPELALQRQVEARDQDLRADLRGLHRSPDHSRETAAGPT